jgi:hypothetical protein
MRRRARAGVGAGGPPPTPRGRCVPSPRSDDPAPVPDLPHLKRQAVGDEALKAQILSIAGIERLLVRMGQAGNPEKRAERLHAVVGFARRAG